MSQRKQLIERAKQLGIESSDVGDAFLTIEAEATKYTEYCCAIPTFAQTPFTARAYMEAYTSLSPQGIELGLDIRRIRNKQSTARQNTLLLTEEALDLNQITGDNGEVVAINIPKGHRREQLAHLAIVATEPHIDLYVIPRTAWRPDYRSLFLMEDASGNKTAFQERAGDITPPITDCAELEQYESDLANLVEVSMSRAASSVFLRNMVR